MSNGSIASLIGVKIGTTDGKNTTDTFMGKSDKGRNSLVTEAISRTALRAGDWLMIPPYEGESLNHDVNIEMGNSAGYQVYNLKLDVQQKFNRVKQEPCILKKMIAELNNERKSLVKNKR